MAVKYAPSKLAIPPGFQNLLESLSREVLREQPEDIIKFAAQYFRDKLKLRKEAPTDSAEAPSQAPTQQQSPAPKEETRQDTEDVDIDTSDPAVEQAAVKIQAVFRGHKERQSLKDTPTKQDSSAKEEPKQDDIAQVEQEEPPPKYGDTQEAQEIDIDLDDPATAAAALKIQAGFRGHKARQELKANQASKTDETTATTETETPAENPTAPDTTEATGAEKSVPVESVGADEQDDDKAAQETAAIRIQSSFRGHRVRKEMKASRVGAGSDNLAAADDANALQGGDANDSQGDVVNVAAEDDAETTAEAAVDQDTNQDSLVTPTVDSQPGVPESDEEANKAAIKIQASFRGHQVRKNMKVKTDDVTAAPADASDDIANTDTVEGETE